MIARGTIWRSKHLPKRRNDALPFRKKPQKRPPSFDSGLRLLTNPRRGMGRREASPLSIRFDGRRGASILWIEPSASRLIAGMENPPGFPPYARQPCIFREKTLAFAEKNEYLPARKFVYTCANLRVKQSRRCLWQPRPARANPSDSSAALPALPQSGVAPVRCSFSLKNRGFSTT